MSYLSVGAIMGFGGPGGPARVKKPSRPIRGVAVAVARGGKAVPRGYSPIKAMAVRGAADPIAFAPGVKKLLSVFQPAKRIPTMMTGPSPVPSVILSPVRVAARATSPVSALAVSTLAPSASYSSLAPQVAAVAASQNWTGSEMVDTDEMNDENFGDEGTVETDGSPVLKGSGAKDTSIPWIPLVVAGVVGYILLKGSK